MRKIYIMLVLVLICPGLFSVFAAAEETEKVEAFKEVLDYSDAANWAYFAEGEERSADVFFICPTVDTRSYANSVDLNDKLKSRFLNAINAEKGIYLDECRFYSPYYRQISTNAYKLSEKDLLQAEKNAALDIKAAFRYYLDHENNGRPFIIAGFSLGGQMSLELLKEYFGDTEEGNMLKKQLIAVYAIGWRVLQH